MNFIARYKKEYLDHINTETGVWSKDKQYLINGVIEVYDRDWNPTTLDIGSGTNIAQVIAKFEMFPNQWEEFKIILEGGSMGSANTLRWVEEEDV